MIEPAVWITGIGLVSSLGDGPHAHFQSLTAPDPRPVVRPFIGPFHVHPLADLDFSRHIPNPGDVRRMGQTQRIGAYAAGAALEDAGLKGDAALAGGKIIVATSGGERDIELDEQIFRDAPAYAADRAALTEKLATSLRPSLFLSELPNLLAGHISILHRMTGGTRTLMGGEAAGQMAFAEAAALIRDGSCAIALTGGALNSERADKLLLAAMSRDAWDGDPAPVWSRPGAGGAIFGSMGAFLVLESAAHARERGAQPYARVCEIRVDFVPRQTGDIAERIIRFVTETMPGGECLAVLSCVSGEAATAAEERAAFASVGPSHPKLLVRGVGTMLGHGDEAAFPAAICLAALALRRRTFYPPFSGEEGPACAGETPRSVMVTSFDRCRGSALARIGAAGPLAA